MRLAVAAAQRLSDHLPIERDVASVLVGSRRARVGVIAFLILPTMARQLFRELAALILRAEDGEGDVG